MNGTYQIRALKFGWAVVLGIVFFAACGGGGGGGGSSPTEPPPVSGCLQRAVFGDPSSSPYVLPYSVGESYELITEYCSSFTFPDHLGLDLGLPMGTPVVASRRGVVLEVADGSPDSAESIESGNRIFVEHPDGTMAFYFHLQQNSARVSEGEQVRKGQVLALSGSSGGPFPHLHFAVYELAALEVTVRSYFQRADSLPINFSNAEGPLDSRGGLVAGEFYLARAF